MPGGGFHHLPEELAGSSEEGYPIDPVSHAVIGSAVAALAPAGAHPAVVWGAILGAEAPDIDFVIRYVKGQVGYLKGHRGPTHGLVVLPLLSIAIAGGLKLLSPAAPFWQVFWFALLGCLSHVLFDFGNDYGTQGLWPFSPRRIAMDLIPIIDVRILGIIAIGWLLNGLLAVDRALLFTGVWVALAVYVIARYLQHRRAHAVVAAKLDLSGDCGPAATCGQGWNPEQVSIHPTLFSWNAWRYVIQQPGEIWTGLVWVNEGRLSQPERAVNAYDQVVLASLKSSLVSAFASWARRPRVQVTRRDGLYEVRWSDMRYEMDGFSPFTAYAWLDDSLALVDEGLQGKQKQAVDKGMIRRRWLRERGILEP